MRVICVVFAMFVILMGCSGNNTQLSEIPRYLTVGDTVFVKTIDSSEYEFEVVEISDSAIIGESITVPINEIYTARIKDGDVIYETTGKQIGDAIYAGFIVISLIPL